MRKDDPHPTDTFEFAGRFGDIPIFIDSTIPRNEVRIQHHGKTIAIIIDGCILVPKQEEKPND